ncbi:hypothetical protein CMT52_14695 [Elizabethkingia anophelis]|nr:hypothetical protein [Elizabethkingia anophelis]
MITINKKVKAKELSDGDIFFFSPSVENNIYWIGENVDLTGEDMIFITDDASGIHEHSILVNGGFDLTINPEDEVYLIDHLSNLLNAINKINE